MFATRQQQWLVFWLLLAFLSIIMFVGLLTILMVAHLDARHLLTSLAALPAAMSPHN